MLTSYLQHRKEGWIVELGKFIDESEKRKREEINRNLQYVLLFDPLKEGYYNPFFRRPIFTFFLALYRADSLVFDPRRLPL